MESASAPATNPDDRGTILIITLILTVVLSVVVLAIATFAATGLRTSNVTTERTESNAVTASGLTWYIEELTAKRVTPDDLAWCSSSGVSNTVPSGVLSESGAGVVVECTTQALLEGHPTVLLSASGVTAAGTTRHIDTVVQVPLREYTSQIRSWTVD
jgi:hypothetical protein